MLADALREEIRAAFFTLTEAKDLKPRWGQRQMIAEVANAEFETVALFLETVALLL